MSDPTFVGILAVPSHVVVDQLAFNDAAGGLPPSPPADMPENPAVCDRSAPGAIVTTIGVLPEMEEEPPSLPVGGWLACTDAPHGSLLLHKAVADLLSVIAPAAAGVNAATPAATLQVHMATVVARDFVGGTSVDAVLNATLKILQRAESGPFRAPAQSQVAFGTTRAKPALPSNGEAIVAAMLLAAMGIGDPVNFGRPNRTAGVSVAGGLDLVRCNPRLVACVRCRHSRLTCAAARRPSRRWLAR